MENSLVTKISLASDHAGFEQKQQLVDYLARKGFEVIDRAPIRTIALIILILRLRLPRMFNQDLPTEAF